MQPSKEPTILFANAGFPEGGETRGGDGRADAGGHHVHRHGGLSALTQKNETLALELLATHQKLLRPIFPKYGGKEIKTIGDAFLVEFTSALDAARCAIEMQKTLVVRNATVASQKRIQIRIGIHVGDVVHQNQDVFGDAVNIASRIEPLARTGGVCVSEDVVRQIQNKIEETLRPIGKNELKNIALTVEVYEIILPWVEKEGMPAQSSPVPAAKAAQRSRKAILWGLSSIILAALAAGTVWYLRPTASKPVMRLTMGIAPADQLTGFQ